MGFHTNSTKIRRKSNGTRRWEATAPLLGVPDHIARRFAHTLVAIANGKQKSYLFTITMPGSGVMSGDIEVTDEMRERTTRWIGGFPRPSRRILNEICDALREIEWTGSEMVAEPTSGRIVFGINTAFNAPNAESVLAFMVAAVLHAGYGDNVRLCPKETKTKRCGIWFADFPKGRNIRKYCCTPHQKQHAKFLSISKSTSGGKAK